MFYGGALYARCCGSHHMPLTQHSTLLPREQHLQFVDIHKHICKSYPNKDTESPVSTQRYRIPCVQTKMQSFKEKHRIQTKISNSSRETMPQTAHITCATCPHSRLPCLLCTQSNLKPCTRHSTHATWLYTPKIQHPQQVTTGR